MKVIQDMSKDELLIVLDEYDKCMRRLLRWVKPNYAIVNEYKDMQRAIRKALDE